MNCRGHESVALHAEGRRVIRSAVQQVRGGLMIRFLPGLLAAVVAYLSLPFLSWLDFFPMRFFLFIAIYAGVTVAVDLAMQRYKY